MAKKLPKKPAKAPPAPKKIERQSDWPPPRAAYGSRLKPDKVKKS